MTVTAKNLVPAKFVENAQTTQYTVPLTITSTIIDKFTCTNISGSTATVSVNIVTDPDTPASKNLIIKTKSLAASETYTFPELVGQILQTSGYVSAIASAASAINIRVSGREIS
jgi:hypothetical protein